MICPCLAWILLIQTCHSDFCPLPVGICCHKMLLLTVIQTWHHDFCPNIVRNLSLQKVTKIKSLMTFNTFYSNILMKKVNITETGG